MSVPILLVEDSPSDAAILLAAFEDSGYVGKMRVVTNGVEAIRALESTHLDGDTEKPQLILLDLNLPKKSGLEVLEEIKRNPLWKHIPIVILSSSSSRSDIDRSYQLHANAYLSKPREFSGYQAIAQQLYGFWLQTVELPMQD